MDRLLAALLGGRRVVLGRGGPAVVLVELRGQHADLQGGRAGAAVHEEVHGEGERVQGRRVARDQLEHVDVSGLGHAAEQVDPHQPLPRPGLLLGLCRAAAVQQGGGGRQQQPEAQGEVPVGRAEVGRDGRRREVHRERPCEQEGRAEVLEPPEVAEKELAVQEGQVGRKVLGQQQEVRQAARQAVVVGRHQGRAAAVLVVAVALVRGQGQGEDLGVGREGRGHFAQQLRHGRVLPEEGRAMRQRSVRGVGAVGMGGGQEERVDLQAVDQPLQQPAPPAQQLLLQPQLPGRQPGGRLRGELAEGREAVQEEELGLGQGAVAAQLLQ